MWKWIPNYEGQYEINLDGQVRSYWRPRAGWLNQPQKLLNIYIGTNGYYQIQLSRKNKTKRNHCIHELLVETFIGPRPSTNHVVRHLDNNPLNNVLNNLVWGTYRENAADKLIHGTHTQGELISSSKLKEGDIKYILEHPHTKSSVLSEMFAVHRSTITAVRRRERWKHIVI